MSLTNDQLQTIHADTWEEWRAIFRLRQAIPHLCIGISHSTPDHEVVVGMRNHTDLDAAISLVSGVLADLQEQQAAQQPTHQEGDADA